MAKSLAGGLPLSAVTGRAEVMDGAAPGGLGGTYAGNPLALAAAHAVIDVDRARRICSRAPIALGARLTERLQALRGARAADRRRARPGRHGRRRVQQAGYRRSRIRTSPSVRSSARWPED